jgi:hypothetical protein
MFWFILCFHSEWSLTVFCLFCCSIISFNFVVALFTLEQIYISPRWYDLFLFSGFCTVCRVLFHHQPPSKFFIWSYTFVKWLSKENILNQLSTNCILVSSKQIKKRNFIRYQQRACKFSSSLCGCGEVDRVVVSPPGNEPKNLFYFEANELAWNASLCVK